MKKVNGDLIIEARVDCPSCDWCNDLFLDYNLTCHGQELYEALLGDNGCYDNFGNKDLNVITTCKRCKMPFAVGKISH